MKHILCTVPFKHLRNAKEQASVDGTELMWNDSVSVMMQPTHSSYILNALTLLECSVWSAIQLIVY